MHTDKFVVHSIELRYKSWGNTTPGIVDLQSLNGYWKIEPVAPYSGAKANQVLITQVVQVQPKSGTPSGIFYSIFKDSLGKTLNAIKREVDRRNNATSGSIKS
jgi:hypothetical protein